MGFEAYYTIVVILLITIFLFREVSGPDLILFGGLSTLILGGIITPKEALLGFSNPGVVLIGLLFIVGAAIESTGALYNISHKFLGTSSKGGMPAMMLRMMFPVSFFSAFINNTPIVIIFVPMIKKWAERLGQPASKFLIPLSYASIFGGLCTLIGTSSNLVLHGLLLDHGLPGLTLFELAKIGVPCMIVGWIYLAFLGNRALPDRKDVASTVQENRREYVVEMKVKKNCALVGQSVQQGGLRNLKGLFLIDIERDGKSLGPVGSDVIIQSEDQLLFVGVTSAIVELQDIPGLVPAGYEMFERDFAKIRTHMVEVVISGASPIIGQTVKECDFRSRYGSGVVAVHRNGERIESKIGDIQIRAGYTLLLFTAEKFLRTWKDSQDFYLVSTIKDRAPDSQAKSFLALSILFLMVLGAAFGTRFNDPGGNPMTIFHFASLAVILLMVTRCIRGTEARKSVKWNIIVAIGSAIGISRALENSGIAEHIAHIIINISTIFGTQGVIIALYVAATIVTSAVVTTASVAIMFPIAMAAATQLSVDPRAFLITIAIASASSFISPVSYQTNLIVQGVGGYRYSDYVKAGLPLSLLFMSLCVWLIPRFWPL